MGEHFVLLVDRMITESTLESAIDSRKQAKITSSSDDVNVDFAPPVGPTKLTECRICQDDDQDSNMESPCSCRGSLKYAHRACVQKWCNEKGDTTCEICLQQFTPGYTSPPRLFRYGRIPMNFRGNWEISRREQFITMVPTNRDANDHSSSTSKSILYCRLISIIFMTILILRNVVPLVAGGVERQSMALFIIFLLRMAGIVLPLYVMLMAVATFHRRRFRQDAQELQAPEGENI